MCHIDHAPPSYGGGRTIAPTGHSDPRLSAVPNTLLRHRARFRPQCWTPEQGRAFRHRHGPLSFSFETVSSMLANAFIPIPSPMSQATFASISQPGRSRMKDSNLIDLRVIAVISDRHEPGSNLKQISAKLERCLTTETFDRDSFHCTSPAPFQASAGACDGAGGHDELLAQVRSRLSCRRRSRRKMSTNSRGSSAGAEANAAWAVA